MSVVLAAVDNSAAARPVIAMATALAPLLGATVEAVHVAEDGAETARAATSALGVPLRVVRGDPLSELPALIAREDVVAAVVGTRGLRHRPTGHLALAIADSTDKPVLLVPPETSAPTQLRKVLVAMEGTPARPRRLQRALHVIDDLGLELVIVHVDDAESVPSFSEQVQHETDAYATSFVARYCNGIEPCQFESRIGRPGEEILETAESVGADIVAMGWPAGAGPDHGRVTREVLGRSTIPTLLVAVQ